MGLGWGFPAAAAGAAQGLDSWLTQQLKERQMKVMEAQQQQAALNAALSDLPSDMPTLPTFRKANPAASPILILALTSKTMQASAINTLRGP